MEPYEFDIKPHSSPLKETKEINEKWMKGKWNMFAGNQLFFVVNHYEIEEVLELLQKFLLKIHEIFSETIPKNQVVFIQK